MLSAELLEILQPALTRIRLDRNRLVPALKQVSPSMMDRIEPLSISTLKPSHAQRQIWLRSLQQQMIMVRHQHIVCRGRKAAARVDPA